MNGNMQLLEDDLLEGVAGGQSLYEEADGLNRDSWFVSLVERYTGGKKNASAQSGSNPPPGPLFVGEYSEMRRR